MVSGQNFFIFEHGGADQVHIWNSTLITFAYEQMNLLALVFGET